MGDLLKAENRPAAFKWLRDNEYDDIIKNTVACQFGRGEDNLASSLRRLQKNKATIPYKLKRSNPCRYGVSSKSVWKTGMNFPWIFLERLLAKEQSLLKPKEERMAKVKNR